MVYEFDLKTASTDRQIDLVYRLTKAVLFTLVSLVQEKHGLTVSHQKCECKLVMKKKTGSIQICAQFAHVSSFNTVAQSGKRERNIERPLSDNGCV